MLWSFQGLKYKHGKWDRKSCSVYWRVLTTGAQIGEFNSIDIAHHTCTHPLCVYLEGVQWTWHGHACGCQGSYSQSRHTSDKYVDEDWSNGRHDRHRSLPESWDEREGEKEEIEQWVQGSGRRQRRKRKGRAEGSDLSWDMAVSWGEGREGSCGGRVYTKNHKRPWIAWIKWVPHKGVKSLRYCRRLVSVGLLILDSSALYVVYA